MTKNKNICKFRLDNTTNGINIANGVNILNFIFESDENVMNQEPTLQFHRIMLIASGSCILKTNTIPVKANKGDILFVFKGELFSLRECRDTTYMYITFDGIRGNELLNRFSINENNRIFREHHGLIPLWKESLYQASGSTIDLAAESILLYTLSKFTIEKQYSSIVREMIEITKENFSDANLSILALSEVLGYNPKYLSHLFKKTMGIGYTQYLRDIRLKFAVSLLNNGLDSIKNVALLSGFSDPLYFSTLFKKNIGIAPKDFSQKKEHLQ